MSNNIHSRLYRAIVTTLENSPAEREKLISVVLKKLGYDATGNISTTSGASLTRGQIGTIINEMHESKLIGIDDYGKYYLVYSKPVIIRIEKCEQEILRALSQGNKTKSQIREHLKNIFGTDRTATTKDDDLLSTYMGHILKRLTNLGAVIQTNSEYSLSEKATAYADNINEMLTLREDFLIRLHAKGGEFFEHYFITLLTKYYQDRGKTILESYVTGGSDDGGIDGVIKTEDSLGFRETTMVQTKNRIQLTNETTVRGFYGAVCARQGTRGIFVTTSDFYGTAKSFLDSIDNCIGMNGQEIFEMALKTSYGIKRRSKKYYIDDAILPKV